RRLPPSVGGGKALPPSIKPVGPQAQFLGNHGNGLAATKPVLDGFAFERFVEYTAGFDSVCVHGLVGSLFTQFPVRQFEATSASPPGEGESSSVCWRIVSCQNYHVGCEC